jgi:hypothetical protein
VSLTRHLLADAVTNGTSERKDNKIENAVWHFALCITQDDKNRLLKAVALIKSLQIKADTA